MRQYLGERLLRGVFPLWCPQKACGFPVFAEGQGGFLYPPNLLLFPLLAAWKAFNISMVLNFFLGSCFMYAYLRSKVSIFPALIGGITFAYSGFFLCHSFHTAWVNVFIWLPLLFLFAERAAGGGGLRPACIGACVLAVMIFAGHPNACMVSLAGLFFYLLYRGLFSRGYRGLAACLIVLLLIVLLGAGLGAVQLLPMAELTGQSTRTGGFPYDFLTFGSFSPAFFADLVLPDLFGNRGSDTIWFQPVFPYYEMDVYLGILPLLLLIIALTNGGSRREMAWFALWITSIVLMLGKYTPFYHVLGCIPYFDRMRLPCKFDILFCFSSSVLIAYGAGRLFGEKRLRLLPLAVGTCAVIVFTAAVYYVSYDAVFEKISSMDPSRLLPGWPERLERLRLLIASGARRAVVFLALGFSIVLAARYRSANRAIIAAVSLLVVSADLFIFSRSRVALIEPSLFAGAPPTVAPLDEDRSIFRIYSDDISESFSYGAPGWLNTEEPYFMSLRTLPYDTQMLYGVPSIRGGGPLVTRRMSRAISGFPGGFIDMLNGRYIFTWRRLPADGLELAYDGGPFVYRNTRALDRAYAVPDAVFARSEEEAFGLVTADSFNACLSVVIEDAVPGDFQLRGPDGRGARASTGITSYSDHEVIVEVDMPYNGFLVLSDSYYPGWRAEDNGEEARIYRANYLVRAVYLEEGRHRVRFFYSPASFRSGLFISVLSLVVLVVIYWRGGGSKPGGFVLPSGEGAQAGRESKLLILALLAILIALSFVIEPGNWGDAFRTLRVR